MDVGAIKPKYRHSYKINVWGEVIGTRLKQFLIINNWRLKANIKGSKSFTHTA